jgi:histidinol-phosphate aminotransferase
VARDKRRSKVLSDGIRFSSDRAAYYRAGTMTLRPTPHPRRALSAVSAYEWELSTEVIADRLGRDPADIVRFDTNTVPWRLQVGAPSIAAINEYPDTSYRHLVDAIADYTDQPPESIVVGAGADELISLVAQAYLDDTRTFAFSDPTYSMFGISSRIAGAAPIAVASGASFGVDRGALATAARTADVTWLANPNNPTGELLAQEHVQEIAAATRGLLVVDEAYAEFVDGSAFEWLASAPNVAVIRTLSKAFGLAGIRVGYLVAAPEVVATLNRIRPVSSIAVTSARLAVDALARADDMRSLVRGLIAERGRLAAELRRSGRSVIEGSANFVLVEANRSDAERAMSRGLVVRTFGDGHRLSGFARVTVRTASDNDRLLAAWGSRTGGG